MQLWQQFYQNMARIFFFLKGRGLGAWGWQQGRQKTFWYFWVACYEFRWRPRHSVAPYGGPAFVATVPHHVQEPTSEEIWVLLQNDLAESSFSHSCCLSHKIQLDVWICEWISGVWLCDLWAIITLSFQMLRYIIDLSFKIWTTLVDDKYSR